MAYTMNVFKALIYAVTAVFIFGCVASVDAEELSIGTSSAGSGPDKFEQIKMAMVAIRTAAIDDLSRLRSKDNMDRAAVLELLSRLQADLVESAIALDHERAELENYDNFILPKLHATVASNTEAEDGINRLIESSNAEFEERLVASDRRVEALMTDYEASLDLSQHLADAIDSRDALHALIASNDLTADRVGFEGERLDEACASRDEISSVIESLLGNLGEAKAIEAAVRKNLTLAHSGLMDRATAEHAALRESKDHADRALVDAMGEREAQASRLTDAQSAHENVQKRVTEVEELAATMTRILDERIIALTNTLKLTDDVSRNLGTYQAKMQIRARTFV